MIPKRRTKTFKQGDYCPVAIDIADYGVELRQKMTTGATEQVFFRRGTFNRMVKWYITQHEKIVMPKKEGQDS